MAYESNADIMGYGGAAGGGKTDLLLGLAFTAHKKTVIYRRESPQFEEMRDRGQVIMGDRGKFNGSKDIFRVDDRKVELCSIPNTGDERKYQGRPHDLIGFDEVTQFPRHIVQYLMTWLRSTDTKTRAVFTFNPPSTTEGRWVIDYFGPWLNRNHPNPAKDGELRWFYTDEEGIEREADGPDPVRVGDREVQPLSRTFIWAKVKDNPAYAGTQYQANLDGLPEPLRSQMRDGDFAAGMTDDEWQVISTAAVERAMERGKITERPEHLTSVGFDAVRGGNDKGAIAKWYDNYVDAIDTRIGQVLVTGQQIADFFIASVGVGKGYGIPINIDATGVGVLSSDALTERGFMVNEIVSAGKCHLRTANGNVKLRNVRAAIWWRFKEYIEDPDCDLCLPDDPELKADLTSALYKVTPQGIIIEEKKEIKKRIKGRSPDKGEAVIYGYYHYVFGSMNYLSRIAV